MQAIYIHQFGGPDVMTLAEGPSPTPGPHEVRIAIKAAGVNPVDTYIRAGTYPIHPPLPFTPGLDGAGIVEGVGAEVMDFQPGDRVYCAGSVTGTYAEQAVCQIHQVHPLPDAISFAQGAALGIPYATAFRALCHKAQAQSGQRVLIHGASGAVGLAAVQLARALGLTVLATAGSPEGRDQVQRQGAHAVFDHHDPQRLDAIREATQGRGLDLILEMLANANLAMDLELLATGGKVIVIGNRGSIEINPRLLMAKEASIEGLLLMNAPAEALAEIHRRIGAGLIAGTLQPVVARQFPLAQAAQAHQDVIDSSHQGKVVLIP